MRWFAVVSLLLFGCASSMPAGDEAAVIQTLHAACKAYLDGDASRIAEYLSPDFTLTDASGAITTLADDLEAAETGAIRYTVFENSDMDVRLHGDAAIVTGITTVAGRAGETRFSSRLQFTDTLVRRNGRWQVAASHVSRIATEGGMPAK